MENHDGGIKVGNERTRDIVLAYHYDLCLALRESKRVRQRGRTRIDGRSALQRDPYDVQCILDGP